MNKLILLVKGMAIGATDLIPGVSGGTVAVILGIYEKLTEMIANFNLYLTSRKKFAEMLGFLLPIVAGMLASIVIFSRVIAMCLKDYPQATQLFFVGLILGSLPLIFSYSGSKKWGLTHFIGLLTGLAIMGTFLYVSKTYGGEGTEQNIANAFGISPKIDLAYVIKLFFCGIAAASFMIVPGISGSMVLLLLGEYYNVLGFINKFFDYLKDLNIEKMLPIGLALGCFTIGILCGIVFMSKVITYALNKFRAFTFSLVLGLLILSIYAIWPGFSIESGDLPRNCITLVSGLAIALVFSFKK